jgi:tRNA A37 threonylcarbamoyladenosine modification protein TsaB
MNVLALDTSTTHMTVTWIEAGRLLAGMTSAAERNHSIRSTDRTVYT